MEKERAKPPRPKQRTVDLPPPPEAPQLSDFKEPDEIPEPEQNAPETSTEQNLPETSVEINADEESKENRNLDNSTTLEENEAPAEVNEKAREARMSATSYVRELPLDALIPAQTESTESAPRIVPATITLPEAPKPIYPKLETAATLPQIAINGEMTRDEEFVTPKIEHKRIYPNIQEATSQIIHGENVLLNESQLLTYYQNEYLDFVDDFVDEFVSRELNPRNTLHNLLEKFKVVCEQIQRNEDTKNALSVALKNTNDEVWAIEDHKISKSGRCGDDKSASGEANYKKAKLVPGKLTELSNHLNDLTKFELDEGFCIETRARSLALQIQWIVVKLNRDFLTAHNLNTNSIPTLISSGPQDSSRTELVGALSDLFHFLRFPMLPTRFRDSLNLWVIELSSVLLKVCTINNQLFLCAQILRLSSPIDWAVPLLQTYISVPNLDMSKPIDLFLALLSMVLSPVHKRDDFLAEVHKYYEGDSGWNIIDDNGDDEGNFVQLKDTDLIAILGQFNIKALYLNAFQKFSARHQGNRRMAMLSIVSFTLMLLKILDEGLSTYSGMKNVCKKICELMRKTVQYVCNYWKCSADSFGSEKHAIQNEINRIILQATFYIASKKSMGLCQFLVEFPFSCATDFCRMRCMLLLRNPTGTSVAELYEINDVKLEQTLLSAKEGHLEHSLDRIGTEDRSYALATYGAIVSSFENLKINDLFNELLSICFFNEQNSDEFSKVGSEIIATVLDKKPQLLSHILRYIDRRMDHLNSSQILSAASLVKCKLNEEEIGSLLGKWLINRPINHAASVIARRVLSSLDWGAENDLFLPQSVHDVCAETIVKAHVVHCKNRNSLISKSVAKVAKLALKCPDIEQGFDRFCHDLLIRLKISEKPLANSPQADLTAFYVYLIEKCMSSPEKFLETGLNYWTELVNSGCFNNAVVVLVTLVSKFSSRIHLFTANESFKQAFSRLLCADESYAQMLIGNSTFPGPNQLKSIHAESRLKQQTSAWVQLLTCKKSISWNEDKFVLHLLNIISKIAFANDPSKCLDLVDTFVSLYQAIHRAWIEQPKGMLLSWFSNHIPPPLVVSNLMGVSPWVSYLMLQAEHKIYSQFYTQLYQNLGKHSDRSLDEAVKRAATKSNMNLSVDRLNFYRWLEFCTNEQIISNEVYPLALQQLCIAMFKRETFSGKKFSPGLRYLQCKQVEPLFDQFRDKSLPVAEKNATFQQSSSFIRSAGQWIFNKSLYAPNFDQFNSANINMDYLLQMIVSNDTHTWTEFVNVGLLHEQTNEKAKLFATFCQLVHASSPPSRQIETTSLTTFFRQLEVKDGDFGLLIPEIPLHQNLPKCDYTVEDCFNMPVVVARFNSYINEFTKTANVFIETKEKIAQLNSEYGAEFQKLYNDAQTTLIVQIKCGNFLSHQCKRPGKISAVVNASHYNSTIAQNMNENRNKREAEISSLLRNLDLVSIQSAQMEYFCWMLSVQAKLTARQALPYGFMKGLEAKHDPSLNAVGLHLFYRLCDNNNRPELFLFPALMGCFENCLYYLGRTFIAQNPNEQMNLLRLVLSGNPLNVFIVQNFTPHCVDADVLLLLYGELSTSVRNAASTEASLALLERLDIDNTDNHLPPHHFTSLMPVIFENLASVPIATKLHNLCVSHFQACMFHSFPNNFLQGFRLLLSGIDSRSIPTSLFDSIANRLQVDAFLSQTANNSGAKTTVSVEIARQSIRLISQQLMKSRQDLTTNLFAVWLDYLEPVCKFADFFVRTVVCQEFASEAPQSIIETGLRDIFTYIISVWNAFLEPVGPSALPPFNIADTKVAESVVVSRFVDLMIWLPHSAYLAPGSESIETLFWQYFVKKLLCIQKAGSSHVYAVYENQFSRLFWSRFWPNLLDLSAMEQAFETPDVGPLITEILIRIQWPQIVTQMDGQPAEAFRAFYSLLLIVFSRVVQNQKNYAKSRATVEKLLFEFSTQKWYYVKTDSIEKVSNLMASAFPADSSIANPSGPLNAFFNIWREACFFSTKQSAIILPNSPDANPQLIAQKQAFYIRAHVHLLLRANGVSSEDKLRMYKELLDKCYLLIGATQNQQISELKMFTPIAKELIAFWPEISKEKLSSGLSKTLIDWLNQHPDSILVLLIMDAAIETLGKAMPQGALKLLDNAVSAYFKRRLHCEWSEVCSWINIPSNNFKEWLFTTPSSESGVETRFLTLNALLLNEMSKLGSVQEEEKLMKRLADYLDAIKPKYVTNEPAFVICLEKWQRMVIRQYSNGVVTGVANERLEAYLNYLRKIWSEEKGVSFFNVKAIFGKKQAFPMRLQLLTNIMTLYINQQQCAIHQPPRMQQGQPVMSSRISAFKDLQSNKAFQEIENVASVFQLANPFFNQHETYNLNHAANLFYKIVSQLYPRSNKLLQHLDS